MIISDENTLLTSLEELKTFLSKRKYPSALIEDSILKVKALKRIDLLQPKELSNADTNLIPYVTTFNPNNPEIFPDIRQNKSVLLRNDRMKSIYKHKVFLKSKRQSPNLKKILTKTKFSSTQETKFKCNESRCGLCEHIKEGPSFSFKGKTFTVKYAIYVIECRGCKKYYIGETNNLRKRTTLHNQHIRHKELRMIPLSRHLASCSDNDPKYFMFPFYKMSSDSILERKEKEKILYEQI